MRRSAALGNQISTLEAEIAAAEQARSRCQEQADGGR